MDEIEPRLKYIRIRNDLEHILQNDAASCIAVHPKVRIIYNNNQNFNLKYLKYLNK